MERKLETLLREYKKLRFTKVGKSALVHTLPWNTFSEDADSACFVGYYTARSDLRSDLRSEFTIYDQQRPFDEIAAVLLERCKRNPETNWWAIAHIYPEREGLEHLSDDQKGQLLGRWYALLQEVVVFLREVWETSDFRRDTM